MIAAIYARKSPNPDAAAIADDARSVIRQVERARQYAARKGWTVAEAHIYQDDQISGAEYARRPDFLRLMNALKPRAPFQVLIMSEGSRLGREQIETAWSLKQLITAGVRVFSYLEDAVKDYRGVLMQQTTEARGILRELLVDRVLYTPTVRRGERWCELRPSAPLVEFSEGHWTQTVVAPTGFEPVFQSRSRSCQSLQYLGHRELREQ